jgi:predicted metal-dependent peptidase
MTTMPEKAPVPCTPAELKSAEVILDKASTLLMFHHELYTKFILSTKFVANEGLPAVMGIRPVGTHLEILYNPRMMLDEKLVATDIVEILRHEYGHILLHHVWSPLPMAVSANIAGDIEINQYPWVNISVGKWLAEHACTPAKFKFTAGETREEYYKNLEKQVSRKGSGKGQDNSTGQVPGGDDSTPSKVDSHGQWGSSETQSSEEIWRRVVSDAMEEAKSRGTVPGSMYETIMANWKKVPQLGSLLRRIIARFIALSVVESDTRARPNRRFQLLPGVKESYGPTIVWAIDTSGSMSAPELQVALGVLRWINRKYPVSIIHCDAGVTFAKKNVTRVSKKMDMKGRGGTSFEPVFNFIHEKWHDKVDLLVFVSDMEGSFPDKVPPYKTIWLSTTGHKAPFGKTIVINHNK